MPLLGLVARGSGHRHVFERNSVERCQTLHIAVVGDDEGNLAEQFARAPAVQQIGHAVQILRTEEGHARQRGAGGQLPAHVQLRGQRGKGGPKALQIEASRRRRDRGRLLGRDAAGLCVRKTGTAVRQAPLDAHEEEAQFVVLVLVGVEDVGAAFIEQRRDARHQALAVRAIDEQNGGIFHA